MKTFLLTALLFIVFGFTQSSGEKIKAKDGVVTVDTVPYFKYEYKKVVRGYDIMKVNDEKLFFLRSEEYYDPARISKSNTTGRVSYASLIREGQSTVSCELDMPNPKYVAKLLLEYSVLDENGNIVEANFQKMVSHVGMTYSAGRPVVR